MPYRYDSKRTVTVWMDESLLYEASELAMQLGFKSFSEFVNELLREALAAAELSRELGLKQRESRRKFVLSYIFSKIKSKLI